MRKGEEKRQELLNAAEKLFCAKGYEGTDELIKELQEYVKKNTAPYKYPRIVEFVEELPKTFNGKIKRNAIRENDMNKANQ